MLCSVFGLAVGAASVGDRHWEARALTLRCSLARSLALTAKAIDGYQLARESPDSAPVDPRLEVIVERMFETCERDGEYKQVSRERSSRRLRVHQRSREHSLVRASG